MRTGIAALVAGLIGVLSYARVWIALVLALLFVCAAYWFVGGQLKFSFLLPAFALLLLAGTIGTVFERHAREFGQHARSSDALTPGKSFAVVFLILALSSASATGIGWVHSVDVRGSWPLIITLYLFLNCVYALIFVALAQFRRPFNLSFVISYNVALGLLVVLQPAVFYKSKTGAIPWLSSEVQTAFHSSVSIYVVYALFLLGTAVLALIRRARFD
jgi:hypothetical protein